MDPLGTAKSPHGGPAVDLNKAYIRKYEDNIVVLQVMLYLIRGDDAALRQFIDLAPPSNTVCDVLTLLDLDRYPRLAEAKATALAAFESAFMSVVPNSNTWPPAKQAHEFAEKKLWLQAMITHMKREALKALMVAELLSSVDNAE
jgi:hypothetical protein